jgi:methylglutaconyl-CoA hydratase
MHSDPYSQEAELQAMQFVKYHAQGRIGFITMNRPEKRNALNYEMVAELKQAFEAAEKDEACKVIVLRAEGKVFCAGVDLEYLQRLQAFDFHDNLADSNHLMQLFHQIYSLKKVVIAQVHGAAIAGGCGLAAVCDFSFTVPDTSFGFTEVRIGFVPAIVMVYLVRKIGEAKARRLLLSGELVQAEEAVDLGLINRVVEEGQLERRVQEFAQMLCQQNSGQSMDQIKQMIGRVQEMPLVESLRYAAEMNALARETEDCIRGISFFLAKEQTSW